MSHALFPDDVFDLAGIARAIAAGDPERTAVIAPDGRNADGTRRYRRYSYRTLSHDVESVAVGMREIGIRERTRAVFMAPPSYAGCVAGLALTRVGATTVWIDPSVGWLNVAERLGRLDVEAFIGIRLAHLARTTFGWGPRLSSRAISIDGWFPGAHTLASLKRTAPAVPGAPSVGPSDPASIMYTTGSTGPAKPALYEHRNLCGIFRLAHHTWRFAESGGVPVDMPVFPAFFTIGLSAGGTIVIPPIDYVRQGPGDVDPAALLEVIGDCGVQTLFASPVILQNLARQGEKGATARSLRTVIGGGAPLYAGLVAPLRAMMGAGGEVHADYGATEALPATELPGHEALFASRETARGRGLCVGRPFDGVELKIVAVTDGPIATLGDVRELPIGEIGEILVRGPHVSPRYADDAESTRANKIAGADGSVWHRLGDVGYLDPLGRLWCGGRVGHRVVMPSTTLYPLMCEPIFDAHPRVRRSALVGVTSGDAVVPALCVELRDGATRGGDLAQVRAELLAIAAQHDTTRVIRHVLFHPRLPVDPRHNSKIERPALRRWAASRLHISGGQHDERIALQDRIPARQLVEPGVLRRGS